MRYLMSINSQIENKKILENKIKENKKLEHTLEETNKQLSNQKKVTKVEEQLDRKIEVLKFKDMTEMSVQTDGEIKNVQEKCEKKIEKETRKKSRIGKVRTKVNHIEQEIQDTEQTVKHVEKKWKEAIVGYHVYIKDHMTRKNTEIDETFEVRKSEIMERNDRIGTISYMHTDWTMKFNEYIHKIHSKTFVNSLRNKIRNINNIGDIKDILTRQLSDLVRKCRRRDRKF